jgi:bifunctional glutamyl/prolyl-tRNA synthetase
VAEVFDRHNAQGVVVAGLKAAKADKVAIAAAVSVLLGIKKEYTDLTGKKVPRAETGGVGGTENKAKATKGGEPAAAQANPATVGAGAAGGSGGADPAAVAEIMARHGAQGAVVGGLKKAKAAKADVEAAVAALLAIKLEYKQLTGEEIPRPDSGKKKKKK